MGPLAGLKVIDLTRALSPSFPTPWKDPLALEQVGKLGKQQWNIFRRHLNEHIGTHQDAPLHRTDLDSADRILEEFARECEGEPDEALADRPGLEHRFGKPIIPRSDRDT